MKVLVTGGLGFIGSNLVETLVNDEAEEVTIFDNLSTGDMKSQQQFIKSINDRHKISRSRRTETRFAYVDIIDSRQIMREYQSSNGYDVIYHLAALPRIQPSFLTPMETLEVNCQGTVNILELARISKAKMVYAGSSSFYGDPSANPYAHSKWIGEEHCKMYNKVYGVSAAIARFFNVYGNRQIEVGEYATLLGIFEHQKKNNKPLTITGTGEKRRDFTHVSDIVNGLIAMSSKNWNGEIFNLGRGKNYSINEVAQMFKPEKVEYIPARPGEAQDTLADLSFSLSNLDWKPQVNLPEYVEAFLGTL